MRSSASQALKRTLHRLKGLVEEAKRRTILWFIFIAGFAYLLSLTSSSVWLNVPVAAAFFILIRHLSFVLEIRRKVHIANVPAHLSHLLKHQLSSDELLLSSSTSTYWRRKIDSPVIEEALDCFTRRIVQEFVTNLWYSALSPDQDVPEQIRLLVIDIFGELGQRVKRINLINLLTRDIVELVGNHLELFRQARCNIKRFESLSSDDREKELKLALTKGNQLHPALFSPDSECKVLQQLMGGMVTIVLRPQDAQCVLMKGLARELLACAVLRPVINFANPGFINKTIERVIVLARAKSAVENSGLGGAPTSSNLAFSKGSNRSSAVGFGSNDSAHGRREERGQAPEVVNERRSRTLTIENLDNLSAKGQDYKKRDSEKASIKRSPGIASVRMNDSTSKLEKQDMQPAVKDVFVKRGASKLSQAGDSTKSTAIQSPTTSRDVKQTLEVSKGANRQDNLVKNQRSEASNHTRDVVTSSTVSSLLPGATQGYLEKQVDDIQGTGIRHKRTHSSNTGSDNWQKLEHASSNNISTFDYWDTPGMQVSLGGNDADPLTGWLNEPAGTVGRNGEVQSASKLNCWVVGAHLEKAASKTFAVYSIAVTDTNNNTWFVERRFRNFEQLHRKLRDLPQYNLQLPPKRFLSSSLDETFVRDRCILLDKYLKDLLSIPSIAELHEVWDFLSITSKNYAYSKSPSVMKTLAVNVDDAVDDMFRQLRGVSDGLLRRVGGPSPSDADEANLFVLGDGQKQIMAQESSLGNFTIDKDKTDLYSDEEFTGPASTIEDAAYSIDNWPFDNDLHDTTAISQTLLGNDKNVQWLEKRMERGGSDAFSVDESTTGSETYEEDFAVPPEWTPPKLTEPLLKLVDNIFQLQDRGWIRRQGFWIAKQILQLGIGDAVDDWLVTQIQQLRQEDVVAGFIRSLQEILWPGGVFITKVQKGDNLGVSGAGSPLKIVKQASQKSMEQSASFEAQLEAARCAKAVHDCLLEGAPQPLVSFVGKQQYAKSAKDIYYFLQSSVFLKQLVFSILETLLITVFPEMTRLILDIRYQGI